MILKRFSEIQIYRSKIPAESKTCDNKLEDLPGLTVIKQLC